MNTERIISHTKYRLAGLLASVALLAAGCTADEDTDAPYLYFGEEIESLSYTVNGGSLTVEMYSNMGPWVVTASNTTAAIKRKIVHMRQVLLDLGERL